MRRGLFAAAAGLGLLPLASAFAQTIPPSTLADRTLRQGDIIEWSAVSGDHQVRFGGLVGTTTLTPVTEVDDHLGNFDPSLKIDGAVGVAPEKGSSNTRLLTAKVLDAAQVDKTFNFTCGVHPADMLSRAFKIEAKVAGEAPRTFKITGVNGRHWILEKPDGNKVSIDTTPP